MPKLVLAETLCRVRLLVVDVDVLWSFEVNEFMLIFDIGIGVH